MRRRVSSTRLPTMTRTSVRRCTCCELAGQSATMISIAAHAPLRGPVSDRRQWPARGGRPRSGTCHDRARDPEAAAFVVPAENRSGVDQAVRGERHRVSCAAPLSKVTARRRSACLPSLGAPRRAARPRGRGRRRRKASRSSLGFALPWRALRRGPRRCIVSGLIIGFVGALAVPGKDPLKPGRRPAWIGRLFRARIAARLLGLINWDYTFRSGEALALLAFSARRRVLAAVIPPQAPAQAPDHRAKIRKKGRRQRPQLLKQEAHVRRASTGAPTTVRASPAGAVRSSK